MFPHLNDAWWRLWLVVWIVYNLHWSIIDQTSSQKYLKSDLSVINALVSHLLLLCSILKIWPVRPIVASSCLWCHTAWCRRAASYWSKGNDRPKRSGCLWSILKRPAGTGSYRKTGTRTDRPVLVQTGTPSGSKVSGQRGTWHLGQRPPFHLLVGDTDHFLCLPVSFLETKKHLYKQTPVWRNLSVSSSGTDRCLVEPKHAGTQSTSDKAFCSIRVMEESNLQRNRSLWSQVQGLQLLVGGPVPDVQRAAVVTCRTQVPTGQLRHLSQWHHTGLWSSPSATWAGLKPPARYFGAPHSVLIITLCRGWYQKSYPKGAASPGCSQFPITSKVSPSSNAKPPERTTAGEMTHPPTTCNSGEKKGVWESHPCRCQMGRPGSWSWSVRCPDSEKCEDSPSYTSRTVQWVPPSEDRQVHILKQVGWTVQLTQTAFLSLIGWYLM